MRIAVIYLVLSIMIFACHASRKVQKTQTPISEVDTTPPITLNNSIPDSLPSSKDVFNKVVNNQIEFLTFNAKARVEYKGPEGEDDANAFVRIKKDSAIWISLRGALGIEGFRVLITRDSVKVINFLKKYVQHQGIGYLQEISGMAIDFETLQDLVIGNPIFIDTNIVSHEVNSNNELLVTMAGALYKNLVALDNSDNRLLYTRIDEREGGRNRRCNISFSNYENATGVLFSTGRKISVAD